MVSVGACAHSEAGPAHPPRVGPLTTPALPPGGGRPFSRVRYDTAAGGLVHSAPIAAFFHRSPARPPLPTPRPASWLRTPTARSGGHGVRPTAARHCRRPTSR